jgi:hypothetical protein
MLRHTFASVAGDLGFSELMSAGLLGHPARGVRRSSWQRTVCLRRLGKMLDGGTAAKHQKRLPSKYPATAIAQIDRFGDLQNCLIKSETRKRRPSSFFRTKRDVGFAGYEQPDIKRRSKEALITRLFEIDASPGELNERGFHLIGGSANDLKFQGFDPNRGPFTAIYALFLPSRTRTLHPSNSPIRPSRDFSLPQIAERYPSLGTRNFRAISTGILDSVPGNASN